MRAQPMKNSLIGVPDVFALDNNILREYISVIYGEYKIADPLQDRKDLGEGKKYFSRDQYQRGPSVRDHTPKKIGHQGEEYNNSTYKKNK